MSTADLIRREAICKITLSKQDILAIRGDSPTSCGDVIPAIVKQKLFACSISLFKHKSLIMKSHRHRLLLHQVRDRSLLFLKCKLLLNTST